MPEQWTCSLTAKNGRFKKRQEKRKKKGPPTPDPHVDGGNGKKAIVYNTKKGKKWEGQKKKDKEKRKRKKKRKRKELSTLSHSIKAYPRILSV